MLTVYLPRWKNTAENEVQQRGVCQVHTSALGHETVTTMSVKLWGRGFDNWTGQQLPCFSNSVA